MANYLVLITAYCAVGIDVPDELCSGLAPILNGRQLELQKGAPNEKFTLNCGDNTVVRIGAKYLSRLQFLNNIKTSQFGQPCSDETSQIDGEMGYTLGAALYDKHGHPVKKKLTEQEQTTVLDSYRQYYNTTWHGFPSRTSQTVAMHRIIHLAAGMYRK